MRSIVFTLVALVSSTGCYTYTPIEIGAVTAGADVRARVTAATAEQLGPSLGVSDPRVLSGSVVDVTSEGMTLKVQSVRAGTVGAPEGLFQQILISRSSLLEVESRRLDEGRTRWAVIAGVAGAAALAATVLRGHSSGESAVNEPPANFTLGVAGIRVGGLAPAFAVGWTSARHGRTRGSAIRTK